MIKKLLSLGLFLGFALNVYGNFVHQLAWEGKLDYLKSYLKDHPEGLERKTDDGKTPLTWAAWHNHFEVVEYLISLEANVNAVDAGNNTALLLACTTKDTESIVDLLIKNGALVNAQNNNGITPLHSAVQQGNSNLVSILLRNGANYLSTDRENFSPLSYAQKYRPEIAEVILNYHAALVAKNVSQPALEEESPQVVGNSIEPTWENILGELKTLMENGAATDSHEVQAIVKKHYTLIGATELQQYRMFVEQYAAEEYRKDFQDFDDHHPRLASYLNEAVTRFGLEE